jgi:hypothetical protein
MRREEAMMGLDERVFYLIVGGVIGFALGWLAHAIRNIEEKVIEVDEIVKKDHDEGGFLNGKITEIALLAVVLLTVFAAFSSQLTSNKVEDNQKAQAETAKTLARTTTCTQTYLGQTIKALNERTQYSTEQAQKNVQLQKSQATFLSIFLKVPPSSVQEKEAALNAYFDNLTDFVVVAGKTSQKAAANPYPTDDEFKICIIGKKEK